MRRALSRGGWALAGLLLATGVTAAEREPSTLAEALTRGTAGLSLRYRLEHVSDDAFGRDAVASTLRTALSYRTASYKKWNLFIEAENVAAVGDDDYDNRGAGSLWNGAGNRPVVADPEMTELNQVYGRWESGATKVTLGRQEILIGDQRFVGAVGWRQNHQSFDGLSVTSAAFESWTLEYSFIDAVNRIFGDSQDLAGHLATASFAWDGVGALALYGYMLDYETANALSTSTVGVEFSGKRSTGNGRMLLYELELAEQADAGDNPGVVDAGYLHASLGIGARVTAKAGLERLEGGPGKGQFRTPLATLHKFNGWADKFLATPAGGLEDLYVQIAGRTSSGLAWTLAYHDFSATTGGSSYGAEADLQLGYRTARGVGLGLKAALYDADEFSVDTDKVMLWATYGLE